LGLNRIMVTWPCGALWEILSLSMQEGKCSGHSTSDITILLRLLIG